MSKAYTAQRLRRCNKNGAVQLYSLPRFPLLPDTQRCNGREAEYKNGIEKVAGPFRSLE